MADARGKEQPTSPETADRYEALFGRIDLDNDAAVDEDEEKEKGFWLRLAEDEGYERINLIATYVAVFFAPAAAFLEMIGGSTELYW